ncbi:MAG: uridine kinase [Pseudonocardiales bacterium]|nr:MAG: uridine kinase [Pseudonocardiales bacterium]
MSQADAVAAAVSLARTREGVTTFIGIDGPGGAGKSTLAARVAGAVSGAVVVAVDDFSGPRFAGWDWARFARQLRDPLLAGGVARYQRWDWDRDEGAEWHDVGPGGVIIVEGVSSTRDEAGVAWHLRIWVDTPPEIRHARAIARDGREMFQHWTDVWIPSEEAYIAAQRPAQRADLIVTGMPEC